MSATDAAGRASRLLAGYDTARRDAITAAARLRTAGWAAHATGDVVEVPADTALALLARVEELEAKVTELQAPPY